MTLLTVTSLLRNRSKCWDGKRWLRAIQFKVLEREAVVEIKQWQAEQEAQYMQAVEPSTTCLVSRFPLS